MHTTGYLHVVPNSQYYTDIEQIINAINTLDWSSANYYENKEYILVGLKNSKNIGYNLTLVKNECECDALEYCGRDCPGIKECQK